MGLPALVKCNLLIAGISNTYRSNSSQEFSSVSDKKNECRKLPAGRDLAVGLLWLDKPRILPMETLRWV